VSTDRPIGLQPHQAIADSAQDLGADSRPGSSDRRGGSANPSDTSIPSRQRGDGPAVAHPWLTGLRV